MTIDKKINDCLKEKSFFERLRSKSYPILVSLIPLIPAGFAVSCGGGGSSGGTSTPAPVVQTSDLETAVSTRMGYDNVYLTKYGDGSSYNAESDVLVDAEDVNSILYADLFAEILGNYGTDASGNALGISKDDWLSLFDYWSNGNLGPSPDDEISETGDDYGIGFDFSSNAVRFYLNTITGEKAVTAYLDTDSMDEVKDIIGDILTDVYARNEELGWADSYSELSGEQVLQSEFDPID
jgi:hypothetical protein